MSGIIGSKLNIRGSGRIAKLGTDGQVLTSAGAGAPPAFEDAAGGISWQSVETGATFTAVAGNGYPVNTTAQACTVTLPAAASVGDQIIFTDYARNFATNALTINPNSLNYQGNSSPNPVYDTAGESISITYMDATQGWIPTYDGAVADETPSFNGTVDYLVIAGGGAGGSGDAASSYGGAGGGAGGYRNSFNSEASGGGGSSETQETHTTGTEYTITVGAGGTGPATDTVNADDAEDSSFIGTGISITSAGGGGGACRHENNNNGYAGGSGGGSITDATVGAGAGTANQGYAGGTSGGSEGQGGGGGAGAVGVDSPSSTGGTGGVGVASDITGSTATRSGGGGGSGSTVGSGGTGGGGAGGKADVAPVSGTVNTGGGGGGAGQANGAYADNPGGAGGSGIVVVRMVDTDYSSSTGSPTVATGQGAGSDETILTFTGDGTYTTTG